jgi:hypothetical protein
MAWYLVKRRDKFTLPYFTFGSWIESLGINSTLQLAFKCLLYWSLRQQWSNNRFLVTQNFNSYATKGAWTQCHWDYGKGYFQMYKWTNKLLKQFWETSFSEVVLGERLSARKINTQKLQKTEDSERGKFVEGDLKDITPHEEVNRVHW